MSHPEDPPFLNVGTEVSAKYRGAFCEATIKVAKKLVKCKISYSKGNTALVSNEVIKGPLKVGAQVEVRQPDGQFLPASITKLTDQSTYTVVFDDGDERTLKRSSLCLKGGRHFHESESLDHLPLTDPENFGTPVVHSSKRKRRRVSRSPSHDKEEVKKRFSYPPDYPVGKAVFHENDRRRSCWLPAVIVPAHYVMEESEMSSDTICIRSFKDGRFFAATKDDLHDFAPDKEPLQSMLEGEVQGMYMCKPAIERAMAYLDTGELPWDMDLFDKNNEPVNGEQASDEDESSEELVAERDTFSGKLKKFHDLKGTSPFRQPTLGQRDLNLFKLYKLVHDNGGMDRVTQEMKWRSLYLQLGLPSMPNASYCIKQAYKKYLYGFEMHEKGKLKTPSKEVSGRYNRRKNGPQGTTQHELTNGDSEKTEKPAKVEKSEKTERLSKTEKVAKQDKQVTKPAKVVLRDIRERVVAMETEEEDDDKSEVMSVNDIKSEVSDIDGFSQCDSGSNNGDEPLDSDQIDAKNHIRVSKQSFEHCPNGYSENDRIQVWYGRGKTLRLYQAKIVGVESSEAGRSYLVHYNGWNTRYDEWIEEDRIAGKASGPVVKSRPQYAKKKITRKKTPMKPNGRLSSDSPPAPSLPTPPPPSLPGNTPRTTSNKQKKKEDIPTSERTPQKGTTNPPGGSHHVTTTTTTTPSNSASNTTNTTTTSTGNVVHPSPSSNGKTSSGKSSGRATKRRRTSEVATATDNNKQLTKHSPPPSLLQSPVLPDPQKSVPPVLATTKLPLSYSPVSSPSSNGREVTRTDEESVLQNGDVDGAIDVKREENLNWGYSERHSTTALATTATATTSQSDPLASHSTFGDLVGEPHGNTDPSVSALICSERPPGMISSELRSHQQQQTRDETSHHDQTDLNSPSRNTSSHSSLFLPPHSSPTTHTAKVVSSTSPATSASSPSSHLLRDELFSTADSLFQTEHISRVVNSSPSDREREMDGAERPMDTTDEDREHDEAKMDTDSSNSPPPEVKMSTSSSGSGSEKEGSPVQVTEKRCRSKGSRSPDNKRKWRSYETEEEYERRKTARRTNMDFSLNFSQLPEMSGPERIDLIQEKMKQLNKKWLDLKTEVSSLERKKRRARRKVREAARHQAASQLQSHPLHTPSPPPPAAAASPLHSSIECH